jgi:hypothetical protein
MTALKPRSLDADRFRQRYARHDSHCPVARAASSAGFTELAKSPAGVRMGSAVGRLHGSTLVLFATYLGIGALAHDTHFSLGWVLASTAWSGRTGANHPDLDTGLRRYGGTGDDCRDG